MQEFRVELARCKPEALTDAFLEMAAAKYEAIDAQREYNRYLYSATPGVSTARVSAYRYRAVTENVFEQTWQRWKAEEIDTTGCEQKCQYGTCGGFYSYSGACGGCCDCMSGCQVQYENAMVADSFKNS
jgi:hypothetical protein